MSFQHITNAITSVWTADSTMPIYVEGPPGCGKTSMAGELAKTFGLDPRVSTEGGDVHVFRPSLRDPVDILGTPNPTEGLTRWLPPYELARLREGNGILVIDELPQGAPQMQNALAGLMLDRFVGELTLSPHIKVMGTGNRVQDRAGSGRIVSQLGNRVCRLVMDDPDINEWVQWALDAELDPTGIAFLRWKPEALFDFDPDRFSNATPRSWERALRVTNSDQPHDIQYSILSGIVGEGYGAEYIGFQRMVGMLPNMDHIMMAPDKAEVPADNEIRYVCVATLSTRTTGDNFERLMKYVERLPVDFQVLYIRNVIKTEPKVMSTATFNKWASTNSDAFK